MKNLKFIESKGEDFPAGWFAEMDDVIDFIFNLGGTHITHHQASVIVNLLGEGNE